MRKCLVISLLFVAAMCVGCQTQSWMNTDKGADAPWQVREGLFELGGSAKIGAAKANNKTSEEFDGLTLDFTGQMSGANFWLGYMLTDTWQVGGFVEYASEVWDPEIRHEPDVEDTLDDIDVTGLCFGPRIVYNFSQVDTHVVPYLALSGGFGDMTYDGESELDGTRSFGQIGLGVRVFAWDRVSLNLEGYYRSVEDKIEGDIADVTIRSSEGGILAGLSIFF
jgi:Outer membrane protein beta-barrel domain